MPRSAELVLARSAARPRIALMHDRMDWHSRQLVAAFAELGVEAVPARLKACGFDPRRPSGLHIDGFDGLPDGVLVRLITGGSFEAVTVRLGILHALAALGVPVVNSPRAVEACADKSATSFALARASLATPAAWTVQSLAEARTIVEREAAAGPLVLKPLFGSQGRGLKLIRRAQDLPGAEAVAGVYYLQRFAAFERDGFRDIRVLVSGGRVVAAMTRHSRHWITNIKQGAVPEPAQLSLAVERLALEAARVLGTDIAGVDILMTREGTPTVLEVNSMPGWSGLQRVTNFSVAGRLARDFLVRSGLRRAAEG